MTRATWAVLLTVAIAPAALGLFNEVQDVDPAQYADVARRMFESGDWLHLRDQNGPFFNKPPLTMWLQAAAMHLFGPTDVAIRLPVFALALVTMAAAFLIGKELSSTWRGLAAAALTGASLSTHVMVVDPKVDEALAAMTSLAVALMVLGRRRPWLKLLAWAVAGLAVMAKGPIGLGVPVLALLPEVVRPTYADAPSSLLGRLWKLWPFAGLVVVVAVTAPFYLAMHSLTGEEGTLYLLWNQGFGRLWGKSGFIDDTTPLFFVHTAVWAFLPFSPLLFTALSRRLSMLLTTRRLPGSLSRVPVWWFGLTFLVISLSTYKLPHYLFVLTVPAALLTAEELERFDDRAASRWRLGFLVLSVIAWGLGGLAFWLAFPAPWPVVVGWLLVLAVPVVVQRLWARRLSGTDALLMSAVVSLSGLWAFFSGFVQPALLEYQPSRELGALVRREDPDSAVLPVLFIESSFSFSFYARRDARYLMPADLRPLLVERRARVAVVGSRYDAQLFAEAGIGLEPLASFSIYPTSRPAPAFLLAASREGTLQHLSVMRVFLKD